MGPDAGIRASNTLLSYQVAGSIVSTILSMNGIDGAVTLSSEDTRLGTTSEGGPSRTCRWAALMSGSSQCGPCALSYAVRSRARLVRARVELFHSIGRANAHPSPGSGQLLDDLTRRHRQHVTIVDEGRFRAIRFHITKTRSGHAADSQTERLPVSSNIFQCEQY